METLISLASVAATTAVRNSTEFPGQCRLYMTAFSPKSSDPCAWFGFSSFTGLVIIFAFLFCLISPLVVLGIYVARRCFGKFGSSKVTTSGYKSREQIQFRVAHVILTIVFIALLVGLLFTICVQLAKSAMLLRISHQSLERLKDSIQDTAKQFKNTNGSILEDFQGSYDGISKTVGELNSVWSKIRPDKNNIITKFENFIADRNAPLISELDSWNTVIAQSKLNIAGKPSINYNTVSNNLSSITSTGVIQSFGQETFTFVSSSLDHFSTEFSVDSEMNTMVAGMKYLDDKVQEWDNSILSTNQFSQYFTKVFVTGKGVNIAINIIFIFVILVAIACFAGMSFFAAPKKNVKALNFGALGIWLFLFFIAAICAINIGVFMMSMAFCRASKSRKGNSNGYIMNIDRLSRDMNHYWRKSAGAQLTKVNYIQMANFTSYMVSECRSSRDTFLNVAQAMSGYHSLGNTSYTSGLVEEFVDVLKNFSNPKLLIGDTGKNIVNDFRANFLRKQFRSEAIRLVDTDYYQIILNVIPEIKALSSDINNYPSKLNATLYRELTDEINTLSTNMQVNNTATYVTVHYTVNNVSLFAADSYPYTNLVNQELQQKISKVYEIIEPLVENYLEITTVDMSKIAEKANTIVGIVQPLSGQNLADQVDQFISRFDSNSADSLLPASNTGFDDYTNKLTSLQKTNVGKLTNIAQKQLNPIISDSPTCSFMRDSMDRMEHHSCGAVFGLRWIVLACIGICAFILVTLGPFYWFITLITGKKLSKGHRILDDYDMALLDERVNSLSRNSDL
jgi:hypothetical protein